MTRPYSGAETAVMFGTEATFGTAVTPDSTFGANVEIDDVTITNNYEAAYGIGSRVAGAMKEGRMEGTISLSFDLTVSDHDWLPSVWPDTTTTPGSYLEDTDIDSITIAESYGGKRRTYAGCVPVSFRLDAGLDTPPRVSMEFLFASHTESTAAALEPGTPGAPYLFSDATLALGGTTVACFLQSFNLNVALGNGLRYGAGDVEACGYGIGRYEYTASAEYLANATTELMDKADDRMLENGTVTFARSGNSMVFTLTDIAYESVSVSIPGVEDRSETLEMNIRSASATVVTAP